MTERSKHAPVGNDEEHKRPLGSWTRHQDTGATTARRTLADRGRGYRPEEVPVHADWLRELEERLQIVESLIERRSGRAQGQLHLSAGEIAEKMGQRNRAIGHYHAAHQANPKDPIALRLCRQLAVAQGDWGAAERYLEVEANLPLADWERASAFAALAELKLRQTDDPAGAERALLAAISLKRNSATLHLLLAESCFQQGRDAEGWRALLTVAEHWQDPTAQALLKGLAARAMETQGQFSKALEIYRDAKRLASDRAVFTLGEVRALRAQGNHIAASQSLSSIAPLLGGPEVQEAVHALAATWLCWLEQRPGNALLLIKHAETAPSLRILAEAAQQSADRDTEREALKRLRDASEGLERDITTMQLALSLSEDNLHDEALSLLESIEAAALESRSVAGSDAVALRAGLVGFGRQLVMQRHRLAGEWQQDADEDIRASGAAEPVAVARRSLTSAWNEMVTDAASNHLHRSPTLTTELARDNPLEPSQSQAPDLSLCLYRWMVCCMNRKAEQAYNHLLAAAPDKEAEPSQSALHWVGADLLGFLDSAQQGVQALQSAQHDSALRALFLHAQARLNAPHDLRATHSAWRSLAENGSGLMAAFALTRAADTLQKLGESSADPLVEALDQEPDYLPALWRVRTLHLSHGQSASLVELFDRLSEATGSKELQHAHRISSTIMRMHAKVGADTGKLRILATADIEDRCAFELALRSARDEASPARATWLGQHAREVLRRLPNDPFARRVALIAAIAFECAAQTATEAKADEITKYWQQAIEIYTELESSYPEDALVHRGLHACTLALGNLADQGRKLRELLRNTQGREARRKRLEAFIEFELWERGDEAAAFSLAQSLAAIDPSSELALRVIEKALASQGKHRELLRHEGRWATNAASPTAKAAHGRAAIHLRQQIGSSEARYTDSWLVGLAKEVLHPWIALQAEAAARKTGDLEGEQRICETLAKAHDDAAAVAYAVQAARAALRRSANEEAYALLAAFSRDVLRPYPGALATLADAAEACEHYTVAAAAIEEASYQSRLTEQAVTQAYRAATLWQDKVQDFEQSLRALRIAARLDVTYKDVLTRLLKVLRDLELHEELLEWIELRLAKELDLAEEKQLHIERLQLGEHLAKRDAVESSLKRLVELDEPEVERLIAMAQTALRNELWELAAVCLSRTLDKPSGREQWPWALTTLGELYAGALDDPTQAEQAYRKLLENDPNHHEARYQLVRLLIAGDKRAEAEEHLKTLLREGIADMMATYAAELFGLLETMNRLEEAEDLLAQAHARHPSDTRLLALANAFFTRKGGTEMLMQFQTRAVDALRSQLRRQPLRVDLWQGLVEVFRDQGREGPARCVASAAVSLGLSDGSIEALAQHGGALTPAAHMGTLSEDDEVALGLLPRELFFLLRLAQPALERLLPIDMRDLGAQKLGKETAAIERFAQEIVPRFGLHSVQLYAAPHNPDLALASSGAPPTILLGQALLDICPEDELLWLATRALAAAQADLAVVMSADPAQMQLCLQLLALGCLDNAPVPPSLESSQAEKLARRLVKLIPQKERNELQQVLVDAQRHIYGDLSWVAGAVASFSSRKALFATGSLRSGLLGLLRIAGRLPTDGSVLTPDWLVREVLDVDEARELLEFATSEEYFTLRRAFGLRD